VKPSGLDAQLLWDLPNDGLNLLLGELGFQLTEFKLRGIPICAMLMFLARAKYLPRRLL
jgi:hypothetical protein